MGAVYVERSTDGQEEEVEVTFPLLHMDVGGLQVRWLACFSPFNFSWPCNLYTKGRMHMDIGGLQLSTALAPRAEQKSLFCCGKAAA